VLICIFFFGAVLIVLGIARSAAPVDEFWTDVAKAGLQIAGVTLVGAVVSLTLKRVEELRRSEEDAAREARRREEKATDDTRRAEERAADQRRRLDEQRLEVFREIVGAYHRVKAVRRNLRALGLLEPVEPLNAQQARGLREQMAILNDAQLSLEAVQRELSESHLFDRWEEMWHELRIAEHYLGECVHDPWERYGGVIWEGAGTEDVERLQLVRFAGHWGEGHHDFRDKVSDHLEKLADLVHEELFREPVGHRPEKTRLPC
jgi:hypothetical protein